MVLVCCGMLLLLFVRHSSSGAAKLWLKRTLSLTIAIRILCSPPVGDDRNDRLNDCHD